MRDPRKFHFDLPANPRPTSPKLFEKWHPAARRAATSCTHSRDVDPIEGIEAIVIHGTAGSSTEGAVSVMLDRQASFHWIVPDENEVAHGHFVWATAPETRAAWHVRGNCSHPGVCNGAKGLNHRTLGIELVNSQKRNDTFSEWQLMATAMIVRYAWAKYPNLKHVVSHARLDPTRRTDLGAHFPWELLELAVLRTSGAQRPQSVSQKDCVK